MTSLEKDMARRDVMTMLNDKCHWLQENNLRAKYHSLTKKESPRVSTYSIEYTILLYYRSKFNIIMSDAMCPSFNE